MGVTLKDGAVLESLKKNPVTPIDGTLPGSFGQIRGKIRGTKGILKSEELRTENLRASILKYVPFPKVYGVCF